MKQTSLVDDLVAELTKQGLNKTSVSVFAGLGRGSISAWQCKHWEPTLAKFVAAANAIGYVVKLEKADG